MQMVDRLKKAFCKNKRQTLTALAALAIVSALLGAGVFAYFHSEDRVTNRLSAEHPSIVLSEPSWDSVGQSMAKKSEPGMNIPKDPCAENDGNVSEYCRIKMTITVSSGTNELLKNSPYDYRNVTDGAGNITDHIHERLYRVINAVSLDDSGYGSSLLLDVDGDTLKINPGGLHNPAFRLADADIEEGCGVYDPDKFSVTYYFYYMGTDTNNHTNSVMQILRPGESTEKLFQYINIPVYKADYLGVFDLPYKIELRAESLAAENFENGAPTPDEFFNKITEQS